MAEVVGQDQARVDPEDQVLIEKLAILQSMYNQASALRVLLPDKLVNPLRSALHNPAGCNPEKLAAHLKDAAISGSRDIVKFKKDYHSEALRDVWQPAGMADFPQGQDGWTEDYISLARSLTHVSQNATKDSSDIVSRKTEDPKSVGDALTAKREQYPGINYEVKNGATGLPIEMTFSGLSFSIQKGTDDQILYVVTMKPESNISELGQDILRNIGLANKKLGFDAVLDLIASYENLKTRPCDKCQKVFDSQLQLPIARKTTKSNPGEEGATWMVLHEMCA